MCIFHRWGKWLQYDVPVPPRELSSKWMLCGATDHMQKRKCQKCGAERRQKIGETLF